MQENLLERLFSTELSTSLAHTDYIVSLINAKFSDLMHQRLEEPENSAEIDSKLELVTEILNDIKVVMMPVASNEIH